MPRVAIGLGANVGDRLANLRKALLLASGRVGKLVAKSDAYESPAWGLEEQPRFLNACAAFETELTPHDLISELKEIESTLGRVKRERWGPREIDLDLILYDNLHCSDSFLTIPHIHMHERAFVLVPLAAIASEWIHPVLGVTVSNLLKLLEEEDVAGIIRIVAL